MNRLDDLLEVRYCNEAPSFARAYRARGKKGLGLKYEKKAQEVLKEVFNGRYLPSPWFRYRRRCEPLRWNYAQPDGMAIDPWAGIIRVVEIKLRHTPDSYFQLLDKYIPLLETWLGKELWRFAPIEVCYWHDPMTVYPCRVTLREDPKDARPNEMSVHICRP